MKILSKKKYNKLIEDFEELQKKVEELKRINESIGKKLENKKTSCKLNNGKDFCFICKKLLQIQDILWSNRSRKMWLLA